MEAPSPRHRREGRNWTRPESYLQRRAVFFADPSVEEPKRTKSDARFTAADAVAVPVRAPAAPRSNWRVSRLIPPAFALVLFALLSISVRNATVSPSQQVPGPAMAVTATAGIRAIFDTCRTAADRNCVHDGASFRYDNREYRIGGLAAPDSHEGRCGAELRLGRLATDRLRTLLSSGSLNIIALPRTSANNPPLHRVTVDGRDVASLLLAEGYVQSLAPGVPRWCA